MAKYALVRRLLQERGVIRAEEVRVPGEAATEDLARDRFVLECVRSAGVPLVLTLAGGYAASAQRTAELHAIAFEEAVLVERRAQRVGSFGPGE